MRTIRGIGAGVAWFFGLWSPPTLALIGGSALSVVGLHMVYPPLAYLAPGMCLLAFAIWWVAPAAARRRRG